MSPSISPGETILNELLKNKPHLSNRDRFTYKEVAEEIIGMITVEGVRQKIKRKELDRVRNGKEPFILKSQLIAYFDKKNAPVSKNQVDRKTALLIHEYDNHQALYWNRYQVVINDRLKDLQKRTRRKLTADEKKQFRSEMLIDFIETEIRGS
jgi:hypothetical protein